MPPQIQHFVPAGYVTQQDRQGGMCSRAVPRLDMYCLCRFVPLLDIDPYSLQEPTQTRADTGPDGGAVGAGGARQVRNGALAFGQGEGGWAVIVGAEG